MSTKSDNAEVEVEAVDEPTPTGPSMGRRGLMKGIGATAAAGVAVGHPAGPVQESEAIAPAVAAGAVVVGAGAGARYGWRLRDQEVQEDIDEIEGSTNDIIIQNTFEKARDRRSQNFSTFIDNQNALTGIDHVSYSEGKIEFVRQVADGASEADATAAAHDAVDEYAATVERNYLESWNETLRELQTIYHKFDGEVFSDDDGDGIEEYNANEIMAVLYIASGPTYDQIENGDVDPESDEIETRQVGSLEVRDYNLEEEEHDLPNGEQMPVLKNIEETSSGNPMGYPAPYDFDILDEFKETFAFTRNSVVTESAYHDRGELLEEYATGANDDNDRNLNIHIVVHKWMETFQEIEETFDAVRDGLDLWAEETYQAVQDGDLDPADLLSERELAELTSEDEEYPQAVQDLMALNIAIDIEREAEIYLTDVDATVFGSIGYTGDDTLETGMVDPETDDESYYLTYDISQGEGTWDAYDSDSGVDGGVVTLTEQPFPDTEYFIDTGAGETAVVSGDDDFTPLDEEQEETLDHEADTWIVDLSDQLEDTVTTVEQIEYFAATEETQFETVELAQEFEIVTFRDGDGEEYDESMHERSESHDDSNYIDESAWNDRMNRHEELIDKYEEALDDASDGGGTSGFLEALEESNSLIGLVILAILAALGFGSING